MRRRNSFERRTGGRAAAVLLAGLLLLTGCGEAEPAESRAVTLQVLPETAVFFDNGELELDAPVCATDAVRYVPAAAMEAAAGVKASADADGTLTFSYERTVVKIPFDSADPYDAAVSRSVTVVCGSADATVDGEAQTLPDPVVEWDGTVYIPETAISAVFDLDYAYTEADGERRLLISTRLLSQETAGQRVFADIQGDSHTVRGAAGQVLSLGMESAALYAAMGPPDFYWGRDVPAAQVQYAYGEGTAISSIFSRVAILSGATPELETGAGITVGDTLSDVIDAYALSDAQISSGVSAGGMILCFSGDTLLESARPEAATHLIEFAMEDEIVTAFTVVDMATYNESA